MNDASTAPIGLGACRGSSFCFAAMSALGRTPCNGEAGTIWTGGIHKCTCISDNALNATHCKVGSVVTVHAGTTVTTLATRTEASAISFATMRSAAAACSLGRKGTRPYFEYRLRR